jgi:hypothetical protein
MVLAARLRSETCPFYTSCRLSHTKNTHTYKRANVTKGFPVCSMQA